MPKDEFKLIVERTQTVGVKYGESLEYGKAKMEVFLSKNISQEDPVEPVISELYLKAREWVVGKLHGESLESHILKEKTKNTSRAVVETLKISDKTTVKEELLISNLYFRGLFPSGKSTLFEDANTGLFSNIPVKALKAYDENVTAAQTITVHSWFREKVEWYQTDRTWEELLS